MTTPDTRRASNVRWMICGLLFLATTINYVDRNSISVLKTTLQNALNWSEADYGWIAFAFTAAYAIFPALAGRMVDRLGVKRGLAIGVVLWSAMCMLHGAMRSALGFAIARFLLGAAEATNFPAAIKAIALWFPQNERTLATGIFNCGPNLGMMVSFGVVWLSDSLGWPWAFVTIGALGLLWLGAWGWGYATPEEHPRVSRAELDHIRAARPPERQHEEVHWIKLLRYREIWPFLTMKFLTDPVWWFYLYWLPSYLEQERGKNPMHSALLLIIIYTGASVGSVVGGLAFGFLMKRGRSVSVARYTTMLVPAALMPAAIGAYYTDSFALCVALITLATALHQAWSANVFSVATDIFPARVAGSVTGLGSTAGGVGGMFMTLLAGATIQWLGNQQAIFVWAGLMHPLSWILLRLMLGREIREVSLDEGKDLGRPYRPLQIGGVIAGLVGLAAAATVASRWAVFVEIAHSASAVAAAFTAASGIFLIGLLLLYAGAGHKKLA